VRIWLRPGESQHVVLPLREVAAAELAARGRRGWLRETLTALGPAAARAADVPFATHPEDPRRAQQ
jgi:hypothetical protein